MSDRQDIVTDRMLDLIRDQAELQRIHRQEAAEAACQPNHIFTPPAEES